MAATATVSMVPRMMETPEATAPKKGTPEKVRSATAELACCKAEKRGFEPGQEEADCLETEQEVKALSDCRFP